MFSNPLVKNSSSNSEYQPVMPFDGITWKSNGFFLYHDFAKYLCYFKFEDIEQIHVTYDFFIYKGKLVRPDFTMGSFQGLTYLDKSPTSPAIHRENQMGQQVREQFYKDLLEKWANRLKM